MSQKHYFLLHRLDILTFALYIPLGKNFYFSLFQKPPVLKSCLSLSLRRQSLCNINFACYKLLKISYLQFNNNQLIQKILLKACYLPAIVLGSGITKLLVHSLIFIKHFLHFISCPALCQGNTMVSQSQGFQSRRKDKQL